jgi:hypothetical protein
MIFLFPLLLIVATVIALRNAKRGVGLGGTRWPWFAAWSVAGGLLAFSFVTGLSIGLFVLPLAAVVLVWVARRTPGLTDALGFVEGVGALCVLVAFLNRAGNGVDPLPWLLAGVSLAGLAPVAYVLLCHRTAGRSA